MHERSTPVYEHAVRGALSVGYHVRKRVRASAGWPAAAMPLTRASSVTVSRAASGAACRATKA
ncbi:hypothetical protein GGI05_005305 [Coemansia sp. RSA 2603]|nr:hypothetical protein GGI05_005305 [Coemansia sp. RSA 2603]